MKIKDHRIEELREFACDLMSKTYLELGQRPSEEDVFTFACILADDLLIDFGNLELQDIQQSFRQGIRNTKEFHLTVKVYYKWIKSHRQLIWNNADKEPERMDKRLKYRSRKGTGIKKIGTQKEFNQIIKKL